MIWILPIDEPSLSSRKLKPPLESRRVRTQPCSRTFLPADSARRASATVIFCMALMLARRQPAFGVERGHAAGTGRRNRLAIIIVGYVPGREHPLDTGVCAERHGQH